MNIHNLYLVSYTYQEEHMTKEIRDSIIVHSDSYFEVESKAWNYLANIEQLFSLMIDKITPIID